MRGSKRVNLSLTVRMYRALSDYAEIVGRTRTAVIVEAMGDRLPYWESQVRSRRALDWQEGKRLERVQVNEIARAGGVSLATVANQQALSNAERERKRGEKMARRAKAAKGS